MVENKFILKCKCNIKCLKKMDKPKKITYNKYYKTSKYFPIWQV